MKKIKLTIAYDGTKYHGWQVQPNGLSIQEAIEDQLSTILSAPIKIVGAGRTDAGVHALGQVAHFETTSSISLEALLKGLNALLPDDIRILYAIEVDSSFHARFTAKQKTYIYTVCTETVQSPFERRYAFHCTYPLDRQVLIDALPLFIGKKDFSTFANEAHRGSAAHDAIRTIHSVSYTETPSGFSLTYRGDGFLYKMVRNITGTLLDISRGRISLAEVPGLFQSRLRAMGGTTAPSHGLLLHNIEY